MSCVVSFVGREEGRIGPSPKDGCAYVLESSLLVGIQLNSYLRLPVELYLYELYESCDSHLSSADGLSHLRYLSRSTSARGRATQRCRTARQKSPSLGSSRSCSATWWRGTTNYRLHPRRSRLSIHRSRRRSVFAATSRTGALRRTSPPPVAPAHRTHSTGSILKYAGCSEETFILALIYMDQVVQFNPEFVISSLNVHRLLITAIMLASKVRAGGSPVLRRLG